MAAKRSDNGNSVETFVALMQTPAANGFLLGQKLALETTRFWARRMRAYADQMEELARCVNAQDLAGAQQRFIDRMQRDYSEESNTFAALLSEAKPDTPKRNGAEERPQ